MNMRKCCKEKEVDIIPTIIIVAASFAFFGTLIGYLARKKVAEGKIKQAELVADGILLKANEDAEKVKREANATIKEAEAAKKEKLLEAKEESHKIKSEAEREYKQRRAELQKFEDRVIQKESSLDKKMGQLEEKENRYSEKLKAVQEREKEVESIREEQLAKLESISNLTVEEAKEQILSNAEKEIQREMAIMVKDMESQAKEEADKKAREIVSYAIQKCAADHVAETTVSVVSLPNDEMKGRIIGREGRNIRTLESLTGVDFIIDDTPEAVVLSAFDPIRRETARIALEKLISDGRIHPARIEEMVKKAKEEIETLIKEEGEKALFETGIYGVHPELVKLLGRLRFRTSYGQNVLKHSIEIAHLAGIMATEIGADAALAKRAGLLHDIGKAVDHEIEGTHVEIGMDLLRRYKESKEVIHAMSTHHGDYEPQTVEAVLVTAADAISAARPGARGETLEAYIKRLEKLEEISNGFDGVEKSFAIQAGREIRIMVKPDKIDDDYLPLLARNVTKQIEEQMEYPGQIKVSIIRETRAVDYAK